MDGEKSVGKKRKPNWSSEENTAMSEAVVEAADVLFGRFSTNCTAEKKKKAWERVAERVNAVSIKCVRNTEEVKKRWKDMKSIVKKKEGARKRSCGVTGGGSPDINHDLASWELEVLKVIPPESISGLEGAVDTADRASKVVTEAPCSSKKFVEVPANDSDSENEDSNHSVEEITVLKVLQGPVTPEKVSTCCKRPSKKKMGQGTASELDASNPILQMVEVKRQKLQLTERLIKAEERKATALERIAAAIETKYSATSNYSPFTVSPIIKFN